MTVEQVIGAEQRPRLPRPRAAEVVGDIPEAEKVPRLRRGVHLVMVGSCTITPVLWKKPLRGIKKTIIETDWTPRPCWRAEAGEAYSR